jgi:hypothetical protein
MVSCRRQDPESTLSLDTAMRRRAHGSAEIIDPPSPLSVGANAQWFRLSLFQRLRVSALGVLVREIAVVLSGLCVLLRLIVFADRVMMLSLKVVMRRRLVMTSRGHMMFGSRMFRHVSALPCFELPQTETLPVNTSLTIRDFASISCNFGILIMAGRLAKTSRPYRQARKLMRRVATKSAYVSLAWMLRLHYSTDWPRRSRRCPWLAACFGSQ